MTVLLTKEATQALHAFSTQQATLHESNVEDIRNGRLFSVSPKVSQTWHGHLYQDDNFLSKIDMGLCSERLLENLGMNKPGLISGRTNAADRSHPRVPNLIGSVNGIQYSLVQTDFDTYITYESLNDWAASPEFQVNINKIYFEGKREDIKMIGWNGRSIATSTDKQTNSLGEDVNIGWLERVRKHRSENVFNGKINGQAISVGETAAFKNIDQLVSMAIAVIPAAKRRDLVVIASDSILLDREAALYGKSLNKDLADNVVALARQTVGGRPAIAVDYFPENTIFITSLKNLAHRTQRTSIRQSIKQNDEYSCIDRFSQTYETYGLHDYEQAVLIEGISFAEENA